MEMLVAAEKEELQKLAQKGLQRAEEENKKYTERGGSGKIIYASTIPTNLINVNLHFLSFNPEQKQSCTNYTTQKAESEHADHAGIILKYPKYNPIINPEDRGKNKYLLLLDYTIAANRNARDIEILIRRAKYTDKPSRFSLLLLKTTGKRTVWSSGWSTIDMNADKILIVHTKSSSGSGMHWDDFYVVLAQNYRGLCIDSAHGSTNFIHNIECHYCEE